jgi:hypothetical protein
VQGLRGAFWILGCHLNELIALGTVCEEEEGWRRVGTAVNLDAATCRPFVRGSQLRLPNAEDVL